MKPEQRMLRGGRLVIPLGLPYDYQELMLVGKRPDQHVETRSILGVAFVLLTRGHAALEPGG